MVSFTYPVMLIAIVLGGLLIGILAVPINYLTETLNDGIDDSIISEQTRDTYAWSVNLIKVILPMMILFIACAYGITVANAEKEL